MQKQALAPKADKATPKNPANPAANAATESPPAAADPATVSPPAEAEPSSPKATKSKAVILSTRKLPDGTTSRVLMDATSVWKDIVG